MRRDDQGAGPSNVQVLSVGGANAGNSVQVAGTIEGIKKNFESVRKNLQEAWDLDVIEGDDALKRADGDCIADKDYFRKRIEEIKTRKDTALTALETLITTHFDPKADVVHNLMNNYSNKWDTFGKDVETQLTAIKSHLDMDDWVSDGAKVHKQAVKGQQNALEELKQLAKDNSDGVSQVAQVNGAIFLVMQETLGTLSGRIGGDNTPAKTGENYYGRSYYVRTDTASARIEGVTKWGENLIRPYGSDWSGTAESIGSAMDAVASSPANLRSGGIWPEAKSGDLTDAKTGDIGDHTQDDMTTASGDGSAKGTLDK